MRKYAECSISRLNRIVERNVFPGRYFNPAMIPNSQFRATVSFSTGSGSNETQSSFHGVWVDRTRKLLEHEQQNLLQWTPEDSVQRSTIGSLVNHPVLSSSEQLSSNTNLLTLPPPPWWHELDQTIRYWAHQSPLTIHDFTTSWKLLFDVGIPVYLRHGNEPNCGITPLLQDVLVIVLNAWRVCRKTQNMKTFPYGVTEVWRELQTLDNLPKTVAFSIFLSGMASTPALGNDEIDPEDVLDYMIQSPYEHQSPDDTTFHNALLVWARRARNHNYPDAPERAMALLERMVSFNFEPNAFDLAVLLDVIASRASSAQVDYVEQAESVFFGKYNDICSSNHVCCLHLLRAYCSSKRPNGAETAFNMLQDMITNYIASLEQSSQVAGEKYEHLSQDPSEGVRMKLTNTIPIPSRQCFSVVMSGLARRGENPDRVESLLLKLHQLFLLSGKNVEFAPSVVVLNTVLEAYARNRRPDHAERFLYSIFEAYSLSLTSDSHISSNDQENANQSKSFFKPDTMLVNACIHAWAESGRHDAPEKAEFLLNHFLMNNAASVKEESRRLHLSPDKYSYTVVMKAWARSNRRIGAEKCEAILRYMLKECDAFVERPATHGTSDIALPYEPQSTADASKTEYSRHSTKVEPDQLAFATSIYAWARASLMGDSRAPSRAESLYQLMLSYGLRPNQKVFHSLIVAWTHAKDKQPAEISKKVDFYFDKVVRLYREGDVKMRPGAQIYQALLEAKKHAMDGQGAEVVLNHMMDDHLTHNNREAQPNHKHFHCCMAAWASSKNKDAPERVLALLKQMKEFSQSKGWDCSPNDESFTVVINSFARSRREDSAEQAEMIFREMLAHQEDGNIRIEPTSRCCTAVLNAWALSKRHDAAQRAQSLFEEIMDRYDRGEANAVKPTQHLYTCVMNAWMRSDCPDSPLRAQALFDDMLKRHQRTGDDVFRPDAVVYCALLSAWARRFSAESSRKALAILEEMESGSKISPTNMSAVGGIPDENHYAIVIRALAMVGDVETAEILLKRMIERFDGKLLRETRVCFDIVINAYQKLNDPSATEKIDALIRGRERVEFIEHYQKGNTGSREI